MDYVWLIEKYFWKKISNTYKVISTWWDYEVVIYDWNVFRFPKNKEKKLDIKKEKNKLDIVRNYVRIDVPNYTIVEDKYIKYPIILWKPLDKLDICFTDDMINDISVFLKQLHSIPLSNFNFLIEEEKNGPQNDNWLLAFVKKLKEKIKYRLENKVEEYVIEHIHKYMDKLFFEYESPQKAFVHSDLQPKNIIYDEKQNKISWIVDFTDSTIWWIELDFCYFYDEWWDVLEKMIIAYKWYFDKSFFDRVFFLAKRSVIFEIDNDELCENNFDYILSRLKHYKFI